MKRSDLEHIIRAAGAITGSQEIIIFGSQSILAQFPNLPEDNLNLADNENNFKLSNAIILQSIEADIIIPESEEKTILVEGSIGELSLFHKTFGYYAQGVSPNTSKLPKGWEKRLVEICNENTNGITGLCLEVHDLIISKLYAGRKKDIAFFKAAVNLNLLSDEILIKRLNKTPIDEKQKKRIENLIKKNSPK